jgi:hypothetical protein
MKIETIEITPGEKRILLLMDNKMDSSPDKEVLTYFKANGIEAKKEYSEERDGQEYNIMYFGHCYLEDRIGVDFLEGWIQELASIDSE